jgi:hypothetical protein
MFVKKIRLTALVSVFLFIGSLLLEAKSNDRLEQTSLISGGVSKDAIPSIDNPQFVNASQAQFMDKDDKVIGIVSHGQAKAYPIKIMNYHEIVNDNINGKPIAVTYCPLCDTTPVYIRRVNGDKLTFGVSGRLYESCLVMYDRQSNSYWNQPWGVAIEGQRQNQKLKQLPSFKTTWAKWQHQHPDTLVMTEENKYERHYGSDPYKRYKQSERLMFEVRNQNQIDKTKVPISIVKFKENHHPLDHYGGQSLAVSKNYMKAIKKQTFTVNNRQIKAIYNEKLDVVMFYDENGKRLPAMNAFSFVYPAHFEQKINGAKQ